MNGSVSKSTAVFSSSGSSCLPENILLIPTKAREKQARSIVEVIDFQAAKNLLKYWWGDPGYRQLITFQELHLPERTCVGACVHSVWWESHWQGVGDGYSPAKELSKFLCLSLLLMVWGNHLLKSNGSAAATFLKDFLCSSCYQDTCMSGGLRW